LEKEEEQQAQSANVVDCAVPRQQALRSSLIMCPPSVRRDRERLSAVRP
jgi:hypothetical protein